ncbi:MAG: tyrosine-type recombinase/integrase [Bryobacteraceae bacterium]
MLVSVKTTEDVRAAVKTGVVQLMSAGKLRPSSINVYLRAINAFLRWGSLEEHFKPPVKSVPILKTATKVIPTLNETQVQRIVQFKPKWRNERRVHAMAMLILDTGLRLNECLQLAVADVDLDNFLVNVKKERETSRGRCQSQESEERCSTDTSVRMVTLHGASCSRPSMALP